MLSTFPCTKYVAFPRSQYYAPSATLKPLQPQVVQSSRDRFQRFPRSLNYHLHSGLGRSWTPIRCALHPRCGPYASTPLAGTVGFLVLLARSVLEPSYTTTHPSLIILQGVHAVDAVYGASSRNHTRIQAGSLRVLDEVLPIAACPLGLQTSSSSLSLACRVGLKVVGERPCLYWLFFLPPFFCRSSMTVTYFVAHKTGLESFPSSGLSRYERPVVGRGFRTVRFRL